MPTASDGTDTEYVVARLIKHLATIPCHVPLPQKTKEIYKKIKILYRIPLQSTTGKLLEALFGQDSSPPK